MRTFDGPEEFTTTLFRALDDIDPRWRDYDGLIVPGSHDPTRVEEKIDSIQEFREKKKPALLICMGYQLGAIEYARNVLKIKDATSEEFGDGTFVVKNRKEGLRVGEQMGETWWTNYEVVIDWEPSDSQFASPSHPEYTSSKENPSPLLLNFLHSL